MASMHEQVANDNESNEAARLMAQFRSAVDAAVGPQATFAAREEAGLTLANRLCQVRWTPSYAQREGVLRVGLEASTTISVVQQVCLMW